MRYNLKVECYDIDYCVEEEDLIDEMDVFYPYIQADDELWYQILDEKVKETKEKLPKVVVLEVEDIDEEDLGDIEDLVCNELTEKEGWLLNGFNFRVIEKEEIKEKEED